MSKIQKEIIIYRIKNIISKSFKKWYVKLKIKNMQSKKNQFSEYCKISFEEKYTLKQ